MSNGAVSTGDVPLKMLTFGVQNVFPACPALANARASTEMAAPTLRKSFVLKLEASRLTCGKEVAKGTGPENATPGEVPTPWSPSLHH